MLRALLLALTLALFLPVQGRAETLAEIVAANVDQIAKPSRQTIGPVIDALAGSGDPQAAAFLQAWEARKLGQRKSDGAFFLLAPDPAGYALTGLDGDNAGTATKSEIAELKPNAGVRGLISMPPRKEAIARSPNSSRTVRSTIWARSSFSIRRAISISASRSSAAPSWSRASTPRRKA